jgi:hypothetical protein
MGTRNPSHGSQHDILQPGDQSIHLDHHYRTWKIRYRGRSGMISSELVDNLTNLQNLQIFTNDLTGTLSEGFCNNGLEESFTDCAGDAPYLEPRSCCICCTRQRCFHQEGLKVNMPSTIYIAHIGKQTNNSSKYAERAISLERVSLYVLTVY